MTPPTSWLTVSAAAARLGRLVDEVQQMAISGLLHGHWIHDHWSISEASVDAYLAAVGPTCAGVEDYVSAYLAQRAGDPEGPVPVRGGPALDPQTEFEYIREREK